MSPAATLRETLRRAIGGGFDRRVVRERREQMLPRHEEATVERQVGIDAARADVAALHEPERRLERLVALDRAAAAADARERDQLEFELRRHPAACVVALTNFRDSTYARIHARRADEFPVERMPDLGAALCAATLFVRDDAWRLTDREAQERCVALRADIDRALEPVPEDG